MSDGLEVAIVGMTCRFPGAGDYTQFWRNLCAGTESISHFSTEELAAAGIPEHMLADPGYVRAQGVLAGSDEFDAEFFGISPKEAEIMDPQQRILLECAWEALEDAGHDPARVAGRIGVYAGSYYNTYLPGLPAADGPAELFTRNIANEKDYLAARIAYKLDLTGPAVTVQTACSTSLVAVHLACQALLTGECDLALAGGATVRAQQVTGYQVQPGGIFSSDGHCRAFDAAAEGTVPGNGAGIVVLKRLADALADRDFVWAVIRGSATGNDGADRAGFTAPGVSGQTRVVSAALAMAAVDPATVGYVETHGSATPLGDPVEIEALNRAFGGSGTSSCAIGSVKTNIGHTHAAAGIAGLIKTTLAVRHGLIPPSLHFTEANPEIDFSGTPFFVNTGLREWPSNGHPRRAGVSSLGMGGTGAHVVLEQPPAAPESRSTAVQLVPVSAGTEQGLESATDRVAEHLAGQPDLDLGDVGHTLRTGRRAFAHRRVVVAADPTEAARALAARDPHKVFTATPDPGRRSIAFMFPGLGEQRPGVGRQLYRTQPAFREAVDQCADLLHPLLGTDIRQILYPEGGTEGGQGKADLRRMLGRTADRPSLLDRTEYAQPAVFVTEYALAQLWSSLGVRPDAMIGYSIGEYVAACLSGVLSLEDALLLVTRRAKLIADLPAGKMLSVPMSEAEVTPLLRPDVSVAAVNGPRLCVVAGPGDGIAELSEQLAARGVAARLVPASHAFHSTMMDAAVDPLVRLLASVQLNPPAIPYISNVSGTWITGQHATDPRYWGRHLRQPVRFADGVTELWRDPDRLLLELGPGQSLCSLALQLLPRDGGTGPAIRALASLPGELLPEPEERFFLATVGKLWLSGVDIDWTTMAAGRSHRRVPLPTYPFQRRRHWVDQVRATEHQPSLAKKTDLAEWFHTPAWAPLPPHPRRPAEPPETCEHWLIFVDGGGTGRALAARLVASGHRVTTIVAAEPGADPRPCPIGTDGYSMPPAGDYHALLRELRDSGRYPDRIVHLWTVGISDDEAVLARGFFALLALSQALGRGKDPVQLAVVSEAMQMVTGAEQGSASQAAMLGPCRVLPLEHPHITCRSIDITVPEDPDVGARELLAELLAPAADALVALRGKRRWHQVFQPVSLAPATPVTSGRNYVITGGLGGVGLAVARHLARTEQAGLALVGRSALPHREEWAGWLERHPPGDETSARIRAIQEIEAQGRPVLVLTAEMTDPEQVRSAVARARTELGPVHGIVHAAGVAGGGLVQLKDPRSAERVLAPKVHGAKVLAEIARESDIATVVLCSSILAITGAVGQVDYVAANAVLDAVAQHTSAGGGPEIVSVNWDAWQEVGMAHRHNAGGKVGPVDHPLLDACIRDTGSDAVYSATFSADSSWLVDEHRMLGNAVVPGTGHLELIRAAYTHLIGDGPVELSEVRFYTPVVIAEGPRELRIVLDRTAVPLRVTVVSRYPEDDEDGRPRWQVHAAGRVCPAEPGGHERHDLAETIRRGALTDVGRPVHTGPMGLGPRSRCLRRVWRGEREALAELELPERFGADLDQLGLHPSLLDLAAGFVGMYLAEEFRIPISYGRLRCHRPLPRRVYSLQRMREADWVGKETSVADIVLLDEDGREVVQIEDFVLKRVPDLHDTLDRARDGRGKEIAFFDYPESSAAPAPAGEGLLGAHLATGIRPEEGVEALRRVLASGIEPQIVVTPKDLSSVRADIANTRLDPDARISTHRSPHPRPKVLTPYRAPSDELERELAELWQDLLGVGQVGADDLFFELGGHSLLGLELVSRLNRKLGLDVSLGQLFEARTVAELARLLRPMIVTGSQGSA